MCLPCASQTDLIFLLTISALGMVSWLQYRTSFVTDTPYDEAPNHIILRENCGKYSGDGQSLHSSPHVSALVAFDHSPRPMFEPLSLR